MFHYLPSRVADGDCAAVSFDQHREIGNLDYGPIASLGTIGGFNEGRLGSLHDEDGYKSRTEEGQKWPM